MNFDKEIEECFNKIEINDNEYKDIINETFNEINELIKKKKKEILKKAKEEYFSNCNKIEEYCNHKLNITNDEMEVVEVKILYHYFPYKSRFTFKEFKNYLINKSKFKEYYYYNEKSKLYLKSVQFNHY